MQLTDADFATILQGVKRVKKDIHWGNDEDGSWAQVFRTDVETEVGWPLFVQGRYNQSANTLNYALILKTEGRIYALDLGKDHHNPQCNQVGEIHKHQWSERYRDKEAYVPNDISVSAHDPVEVWKQFCKEANIEHMGIMHTPFPHLEMF